MTHFGLVAPPLRGHMDPTLALGGELARRGHRVSVFLDGDAAPPGDPRLTGVRLDAAPRSDAQPPLAARLARGGGPLASVLAMTDRFEALCEVLPDAYARAGAEAIICDQTEPAGALAAMKLRLPYASLANALPLNAEEGLPPPFVAWRHADTPARRWLYRGGARVTALLMRPLSLAIARRAAQWELPGVRELEHTFSARLQLLQIVRELDFPRAAPPAAFRHVGPLRGPSGPPFSDWREDGRPLAFCTLGTLQGARAGLLAAFAEAAAQAGCQPVVAHAGALSPAEEAKLPGGAISAAFLPQRAVLARAAVALVHGGMNTVLDALAAGAPLVVAPLAYEQGAIAARVARAGAGVVARSWSSRARMASSVGRVMREPGCRRAAGALAEAIARAGGVRRAADLAESLTAARQAREPG